ncbi:hypothetical protein N0V91_010285 [Didymella pomorum]|uniref:Uncharacterized protein n=1 Tax=Didymella pomorum TaxID=749634 RepID=A0A9W9D2N4_9PLEO|nr:hypothetical protein N0V91_010285 [Didymella pomorum]
MICLVFYTGNKLTIYIFLLERARVVRAPFVPRLHDRVWLSGMFIIVGGFGSIAVVGYMSPVVELSDLDGRCRIGLPPRVSFPLLCFDVAVNVLLTGVFFWLLRPVLDFHGLKAKTWCGERMTRKLKKSMRKSEQQMSDMGASLKTAMNRNIKTLLWKCLIGSTLVMLPTVANMTQFYIMNSRELGWVCLTICTLDVSWGVIVVNWLTIGSAEAESNLTTLMSQRTLLDNNNKPGTKPDPMSRFDIGLGGINEPVELAESSKIEMRTRQASATTAEVPVFYKAASLKDEGRLLNSDGVRESWHLETGHVDGPLNSGQALEEERGSDDFGAPRLAPRLKEPDRIWGESSEGWAEGSKMWITANDRAMRGSDV